MVNDLKKWWKGYKYEKKVSRIQARVQRVATGDLLLWGEQSLTDCGRTLSQWRRNGDDIYLDEAIMSAEVMQAVLTELRARRP